MSTFESLSGENQTKVCQAIAQAAAEAGVPPTKVSIKLVDCAHVAVLNAGQFVTQGAANFKAKVSFGLSEDDNAKMDAFKAQVEQIKKDHNVNFTVATEQKYGVGDTVAPIADITRLEYDGSNMVNKGDVTITHNQGEVILLDLWATWCPPCQPPMKHNVEMLKKEKPAWKGRVRLIGLGTDQDEGTLSKLIKDRGYHECVEHYWAANGKCKINAQLGAGGIPHVALLNPNGQIVYKGHPSSINLEQAIDDLLATGASDLCPLNKASEGGNEESGAGSNLSIEQVKSAVEKFKAVAEPMTKDEDVKDKCKALARAFFVCEEKAEFDVQKGAINFELVLHVQLMGNAAGSDAETKVMEMTKELREMPEFKVNLRVD